MRDGPELSVVVCSHNGAQSLPGLLASLGDQAVDDDRYEVIVVDDGSTDATAEVAHSWGVRLVRLDLNHGLAAARNAGVSAAQGNIVAFTDDDCQADKAWVGSLIFAFSDPGVDAVGGCVVPGPSHNLALRYLSWRNPLTPLSVAFLASNRTLYRLGVYLRGVLAGDLAPRAGDPLYSVVGANMAFRRGLIFELGGFDEAFQFGSEEEDLCRRAQARLGKARILYEPSAMVIHRFEPRLRDTLRRSRAYGAGNARTALKHTDMRPIVYPFPILVLGALSFGLMRRSVLMSLLGVLTPVLTYPRWALEARRRRSPEPLVYPYIQLAQEASTMLGELDGWRAGYLRGPARHLTYSDP